MNRNEKRFAAIFATCLLTFSLMSCTGSGDTDDAGTADSGDAAVTDAAEPDENAESEESDEADASAEEEAEAEQELVGMPNPMTEMSAEELASETGFTLDAPEGASDVKFFTLNAGSSKTAQMNFTMNGKSYTYRVTPAAEVKAEDTTGLHYEWTSTKEVPVGSCTATLNLGKEASGMYWLDVAPGVNYSLSCTGETTEAEMLGTAVMLFAPVQGEVSGDTDYSGMYMNGSAEAGCDFITMNRNADGVYDVQLSIFRLATFSGTGTAKDDKVEMTLTDPEGGEIKAIFYPEGDGTYSVKISLSTWMLLPTETVFAGFTVSE